MIRTLLALAIFFLFIGALFVISNNNLHLYKISERKQFYQLYFSWAAEMTLNVAKTTGNVVLGSWIPKQSIDKTLNNLSFSP